MNRAPRRRALALAVLLAASPLLATCGDDDGDGAIRCEAGGLPPGTHSFTLEHDGLTRNYRIHVPAGDDGATAHALVLNLHPFVLGGGIFTDIWQHESGMNPLADERGFVVVQPDGTGFPAAWNAGRECCGTAAATGVDDVGFMRALVDAAAEQTCIDPRRVYATGMSNGGYLSHRLACEAPDLVAAVAPVVGSFSEELVCDGSRPVPVLQVTGSRDSLAGRTASYERWVQMNGCTDEPEVTYAEGAATCVTHDACAGGVEVTHCVIEDGGHCWFSDVSPQFTPFCGPREDFQSQAQAWDFLSRWRLP